MTILYNLELCVRENICNVPSDLYNASVKAFEEAGLIGKRRVNHFGRVFQGYNGACDKFVRGHFDIFYRCGETRTMREMLDEERIKASGSDDLKQRALELGEVAVEILERKDVLASLPLNLYFSMPFIPSMEVNTPAGIQSSHIHCEDGRIIQFWKPKRDKYWYDFDTFKNYVEDLEMEDIERFIGKLGIRKRLKLTLLRKRKEIGSKAIENPDSVERINWFNFL